MITIRHVDGVGANSVYHVCINGEKRAVIAMKSYGSGRMWSIFDTYNNILVRDCVTKDRAFTIIKNNSINIPTPEQAYKNAWQKVYDGRKAQAIKHLATKMYATLKEIDAVSEIGGDLPMSAHELVTLIERAALGETSLEYEYESGGRKYTSWPVVGHFPEPPEKVAA